MTKKEYTKKPDTPRKEKVSNRHPLPSFSVKDKDLALLKYLYNNRDERFYVKAYARLKNMPRSSVYDGLKRLKKFGLVDHNEFYPGSNGGNFKINFKGIEALGVSDRGVGLSRRGCRVGEKNLSVHLHKFTLPISDRNGFNEDLVKVLNPLESSVNSIQNLKQHILKFDGYNVIINPKCVVVHVEEVLGVDVDDVSYKCLNRVIDIARDLLRVNIITEGVMVERGHWARIESYLSGFLERIDNRYFLDLGGGRSFWIDHSDKLEDETNDSAVRERVDDFMEDMIKSEGKVSDIDKIVRALNYVSRIEVARVKGGLDQARSLGFDDKSDDRRGYFG